MALLLLLLLFNSIINTQPFCWK